MPPLDQQITELWGQITAATHRFLELVAEFDATEGWGGAGIMSCAHWLNVYCGIGIVAAREKVRVAQAIRALPGINAAFREGRISYSKVRAMTRVATPENEDALLNIAIHGTAAHVERTARYFRRVERTDDGVIVFRAPEGGRLHENLAVERRFRGIEVAAVNRHRDIAISPRTIVTRWQGEPMDYSLAMDVLLQARARTRERLRAERDVGAGREASSVVGGIRASQR